MCLLSFFFFFFFNDTATTEIYTLSLHDALPICGRGKLFEPTLDCQSMLVVKRSQEPLEILQPGLARSEEHTSELQSLRHLVCRLLLEKKKKKKKKKQKVQQSTQEYKNIIICNMK